jgi:uncharacterized protein (DUF983 family)
MAAVALPTGTLLKRGLHRRCPVCGQGHLFRRWIYMSERCPRCSLCFQREPGEWLGSWFLNICLAQILAVTVILIGVAVSYPHPSIVPIAIAGITLTIGFPIWFFPYSRTLWVAIDLAMRPLEFTEGVDPQWELAPDEALLAAERRSGSAP